MKKLLLAIPFLFLFAASSAQAAQIFVSDMTKDGTVTFTPGVSNMASRCNFNWGGLKAYPIEDFFQGATSWSADINSLGRCINMETDVAKGSLAVEMPFVNEEAFAFYGGTQHSNVSSVVAFSTPDKGTPFTITESTNEWNETYITAGAVGTTTFFRCELPTDGLTLKWLMMAGIEKEIAKGYVISMTWVTSRRKCAGIHMTLDPRLLTTPPPVVEEEVPMQCNLDCSPKL